MQGQERGGEPTPGLCAGRITKNLVAREQPSAGSVGMGPCQLPMGKKKNRSTYRVSQSVLTYGGAITQGLTTSKSLNAAPTPSPGGGS